MPYKDKTMKSQRQKKRRMGEAPTIMKSPDEAPIEMVPPLGRLPERPRYLVLSDGQVLDRANPPKADLTLLPGWRIEALRRCNGKMMPLVGNLETAREVMSAVK